MSNGLLDAFQNRRTSKINANVLQHIFFCKVLIRYATIFTNHTWQVSL